MTAAYAFSNYHFQGQMIPYILIDITTPPTGSLSLFKLYVALLRSSSHLTICLLQDFNEKLFQVSHEAQPMNEDDRLENLDRITKEWWIKMHSNKQSSE